MSPVDPLLSASLLSQLEQAWRDNEPVAIATVVAITGSAPKPSGSSLLLRRDGAVVGAVVVLLVPVVALQKTDRHSHQMI